MASETNQKVGSPEWIANRIYREQYSGDYKVEFQIRRSAEIASKCDATFEGGLRIPYALDDMPSFDSAPSTQVKWREICIKLPQLASTVDQPILQLVIEDMIREQIKEFRNAA